jgi:hypothetical protein
MRNPTRLLFPMVAVSGVLAALPVHAAELNVTVEIPTLSVAEYHRPYVAIWLERADQTAAANLGVWYNTKLKDKEGEKWLKDMRQWWRRSGRDLTMPLDGVSGATRAPGTHTLQFTGGKGPLQNLAPGSYNLVVEAAREVGGRELLKVPVQWPPKSAVAASEKGTDELGAISVALKP